MNHDGFNMIILSLAQLAGFVAILILFIYCLTRLRSHGRPAMFASIGLGLMLLMRVLVLASRFLMHIADVQIVIIVQVLVTQLLDVAAVVLLVAAALGNRESREPPNDATGRLADPSNPYSTHSPTEGNSG